jgi:WD40 repeat protein
MGAVYKARGPDGAIVALKLIHKTEDPGRVRREARIQAGLGEKAGFIEFFDSGEAPGGCWLAMPFLEGGTLRDRLRTGPLPVAETLEIGKALARAIGAAHERGIVHRDLKPENVIFDRSGRPFIADLGLAKHFRKDVLGASTSLSLSESGALMGTIGYAPPEQLRDAKDAGPRADVFALGAILHECLAGAPAFEAPNMLALIEKVDSGTRESLAKVRPDLPRALVQIVERALEHDPEDRWADGAELARALDVMRARRRLVLPAVAAMILLAAGALATLGPGRPRAPTAAPPPAAFTWPEPSGATRDELCASFRASTHLRLVDRYGDYDGKTAGDIQALAWLPDGRRILAGIGETTSRSRQWADGLDHTLVLWDEATGRELRRFRGHTNGVLAIAVTGDGKRAISGGADATIRIWDVETGRALRTIDTHSPVHSLAWSAARSAVVAAGLGDGRVVLYEIETGAPAGDYKRHGTAVGGLVFSRDGERLVSGAQSAGLNLHFVDKNENESLPDAPGGVAALLMSGDEARLLIACVPPLLGKPAVPTTPVGLSAYDFIERARSLPPDAPIRSVRALARSDAYVLAGGADSAVVVHDATTLAPVGTLSGHRGGVLALAVSPDGARAVSGGSDEQLHFWDLVHRRATRAGPFLELQRIALAPDERLLAFAGEDGTVGVLDLAKREPLWTRAAHLMNVFHVSVSPDGKHVASASQDGLVRLWNLLTGELELTLPRAPGSAYAAEFSGDSKKLVTCGAEGALSVSDIATGERTDLAVGNARLVIGVAFAPGGRIFASFSEDRSIRLWDVETRSEVRRIDDAHGDLVGVGAFSPDGQRLLTAAQDHTVKLWDTATGALVRELPRQRRMAWALAFVDARRALIGGYDGTLCLWDTESATVLDTVSLESSTDWIKHLALTRDGHSVYASTERGVVLRFAVD